MRTSIVLCLLALAAPLMAQPFFECQAPAPFVLPACGVSVDCEGNCFSNPLATAAVQATVYGTAGCGFPTQGSQYLYVSAGGASMGTGFAPSAGGPGPVTPFGYQSEVQVVIPAGATSVTIDWDFYNAEGAPQVTYNDGMSIDVRDVAGNVLIPIAYADTNTPFAPGGCTNPTLINTAAETDSSGGGTVNGPETSCAIIGALPPGAYLSILCWNGGDNGKDSSATIDNVQWNLPCGSLNLSLSISGAMGPGGYTISVNNLGGTPLAPYFTGITLNQGNFPNGFFAGIDITFPELIAQLTAPTPPFNGSFDMAGASSLSAPVGGGPIGITVYGVSFDLAGGMVTQVSSPISATL